MFTVTVLEIFLFEGRWVLAPAQLGAGSERVKKDTHFQKYVQ